MKSQVLGPPLKVRLDAARQALEAISREQPRWREEARALQETLDALEREIIEVNAKAKGLQAAYETLLEPLADIAGQLSFADARVAKAEALVHAIQQSIPWKLSWPIRQLYQAWFNLKKRAP